MTQASRFWEKVSKTDDCWLWTAATNPKGYGRFKADKRLVPAHRWAYEALVGPIPPGLVIDHLCRVRLCVNPAHMEPVTPKENVLRGDGLTAQKAAQTHCIHGHEFTPENTTRVGKNMHRRCRTCHNALQLKYDKAARQ